MDPVSQALLEKVLLLFLEKAIENLPKAIGEIRGYILKADGDSDIFPTAALLGLGRCGSNVCRAVATRLRQDKAATESDAGFARFLSGFGLMSSNSGFQFLFQPVILLADTDDILRQGATEAQPISEYERCRLIDLSWLFTGGAGNIPQVGQYLTRLALSATPESVRQSSRQPEATVKLEKELADWFVARSYFLDTIGLNENKTRLLFLVFSTGGGTGSGMASELGLAQAMSDQLKRLHTPKQYGIAFEQACAIGIGVLPERAGTDRPDARSLNTGRFFCSYLSQAYRYHVASGASRLVAKQLNSVILVSNQLMLHAAPSERIADAQELANTYISQQIANLLVAQALPSDFYRPISRDDQGIGNTLRDAGIEQSELSRLDPGDLRNSLVDLVVVAYAEAAALGVASDLDEMFRRAFSAPEKGQTGAIEGISLAPKNNGYFDVIKGGIEELIKNAGNIALFACCSSTVAILAVPSQLLSGLPQEVVSQLKARITSLFPSAKVRRFAVIGVPGGKFGLSVFISSSPAVCDEVREHLVTFMVNCFSKEIGVAAKADVAKKIGAYVRESSGNVEHAREDLMKVLADQESMDPILASSFGSGQASHRKAELKALSVRFLRDEDLDPDALLLGQEDVLDALEYCRRVLEFEPIFFPQEEPDDWQPRQMARH